MSIKEIGERVGYVMQNPNQMICKAMIYDEVALGLRLRGLSEEEIKPRVEQALKICGLSPFRKWPIAALSFGQKKRVKAGSVEVEYVDGSMTAHAAGMYWSWLDGMLYGLIRTSLSYGAIVV